MFSVDLWDIQLLILLQMALFDPIIDVCISFVLIDPIAVTKFVTNNFSGRIQIMAKMRLTKLNFFKEILQNTIRKS